jgi:hypothetical protein
MLILWHEVITTSALPVLSSFPVSDRSFIFQKLRDKDYKNQPRKCNKTPKCGPNNHVIHPSNYTGPMPYHNTIKKKKKKKKKQFNRVNETNMNK